MKDYSVLWAGDYVSVISPNDSPYEALFENDSVHVLPVDVETGEVFLREELCPPYSIKEEDESIERWFTVISGGVENGETPEEAALREVREESGIRIADAEYDLVPLTPERIPYMKATSARMTLYTLVLYKYEMDEPEGDGTEYESKSETKTVPLSSIEEFLESSQCDYLLHAAVSKLKAFILKSRQ